jgi:hypothetical protein
MYSRSLTRQYLVEHSIHTRQRVRSRRSSSRKMWFAAGPRSSGSGRSCGAKATRRSSSARTSAAIAFLPRAELLEELLGVPRHEIRVPSSGVAVKADFFVARLWTTGVHDHAETGANTRLHATGLFRGLAPFTSRPLNQMRPLPPVRSQRGGREFEPPAVHQISEYFSDLRRDAAVVLVSCAHSVRCGSARRAGEDHPVSVRG